MGYVIRFPQLDAVFVDRRKLAVLRRAHGARVAEAHVLRRLRSIHATLAAMRLLHRLGEGGALATLARRLSAHAAQIGLTTLARAARDVAICAQSGDRVAFAAVWARLNRSAARSVHRLWMQADLRV